MSKFLESLGECALICQTIEFCLFSIVSDPIKDYLCDPEGYPDRAAFAFTKNWNATKNKLLVSCPNIEEKTLDAYTERRNWVIHNCMFEAISNGKNVHDFDMSQHVLFFRDKERYFRRLAAPDCDLDEDDRADRLIDDFLRKFSDAVIRKKGPAGQ